MDFIHTPYQPNETIAAIATPPGEGGVAIIRISGKDAFSVASKIYSGPIETYQSHTAHVGKIHDLNNQHVDDVLVLIMRGKRSYTGEDTVEIHCHGGALITRKVLETAFSAGARPAKPGEFTFKAFINGKLDLAQAEAVQELISSKNEYALNIAENQLQGRLSERIGRFKKDLTEIAAILEAWVDFPEEDLEFASFEDVINKLDAISEKIQLLINTFHDGKILHDGLSLCLIGSPNVGKSSLMNALLDKERAIVSPIAGTTRDLLEDYLKLNGLNIKLTDTAGIRDSHELIEAEGIRRSKKAMQEADLILLVLDAHKGINKDDQMLIEMLPPKKSVAVWNKTDLPYSEIPQISLKYNVKVSAKEKTGLEDLKQTIDQIVWQNGTPSKEEIVITNLRHKESLAKALRYSQTVSDGLKKGVSPEFLSLEMRNCLNALGEILGTNITEDILSAIFSKFCIGK